MSDSESHSGSDGPSIGDQTTALIANALADFVTTSSSFACGGTLAVQLPEPTAKDQTNQDDASPPHKRQKPQQQLGEEQTTNEESVTGPITIRWDSGDSTKRITLPLDEQDDAAVADLVADTQPATFGLEGKDVYDESYRKATKLDPNSFSTDFCPYELGIVDVVAQALLPNKTGQDNYQGVRAELYKLNVYKAPSGFFKAHVDTPRSEKQIGSLVVCLPCDHEGGQLVVRHRAKSMKFDWSKARDSIQWAAFYSDCEHEVLEVSSGHRITLTYNLYVTRGVGDLAGDCPALDVQTLPLYREVKRALANPDFMAEGGYLGKHCSHAYAHGTWAGASALPATLKGTDMTVYEVFRSLGVKVHIRRVLDPPEDDYGYDSDNSADRGYTYVGKVGHPFCSSVEVGEGETIRDAYNDWSDGLWKITWLNWASVNGGEDLAFAHVVHGNQAEIEFTYSRCALIFDVAPYKNRLKVSASAIGMRS
ncbi:hypothetical protein BDV96DRAFT_490085 [Lophiotrema nucula]|uniref:Fe2OG dioxygenase domain-containing protein n=1 Tax=Lophiotrema nucula TaxID=690887 RepID=A0A6A5ZCQ6_9PLEO|nr:hypothetical protein BDV96DRAFT_490085 [Lophiotrema nucula]